MHNECCFLPDEILTQTYLNTVIILQNLLRYHSYCAGMNLFIGTIYSFVREWKVISRFNQENILQCRQIDFLMNIMKMKKNLK